MHIKPWVKITVCAPRTLLHSPTVFPNVTLLAQSLYLCTSVIENTASWHRGMKNRSAHPSAPVVLFAHKASLEETDASSTSLGGTALHTELPVSLVSMVFMFSHGCLVWTDRKREKTLTHSISAELSQHEEP